MDTEMSGDDGTVVAKGALPETPEESPEKPPAAGGGSEQMAANGLDAGLINPAQTQEAIVAESVAPARGEADAEAEKTDAPPAAEEPTEESPESAREAEPGPVARLEEPTAEDQVTAAERAEAEPPSLGETEPQPAEAEGGPLDAETRGSSEERPVAAEPAVEKEAMSAEGPTPKEDQAEPALAEPVAPEKPAEPEVEEEKEKELPLATPGDDKKEPEVAAEVQVEDKKEPEVPVVVVEVKKEPEVAAEVKKEPEVAAEVKKESEVAAEVPVVAAEDKKDPEVPAVKDEDTIPASGSLSFTILEQPQTKNALLASRTLVVLRGLPGSGKSFLARSIAAAYEDHCAVVSADEHGVKPENPDASADGYKAVDDAVVARCSAGAASLMVVVDDTNHTQERLAHLAELAEQHHLVVLFLEPRTQWCRDVAQLSQRSERGLQEAQLKSMKGQLEETALPLYFGWFLLSSVQEKVRCTAMDFLKTLDTLEAFKKHMADFTVKPETEVDLEQYFKPKRMLHCTAKFCDYGKAEGCQEYAEKEAVRESYGSASELSLTALFVTPRTVGARVSLTDEQLLLWPDDAEEKEEEGPSGASLPPGSRAHVTLGCAEGVEPVQTGFDLLDILGLQRACQTGELLVEMELGSLVYFGEGRWLLGLREPMRAPACFSSFYGRKEPQEPARKETEKKKKLKCAIL